MVTKGPFLTDGRDARDESASSERTFSFGRRRGQLSARHKQDAPIISLMKCHTYFAKGVNADG